MALGPSAPPRLFILLSPEQSLILQASPWPFDLLAPSGLPDIHPFALPGSSITLAPLLSSFLPGPPLSSDPPDPPWSSNSLVSPWISNPAAWPCSSGPTAVPWSPHLLHLSLLNPWLSCGPLFLLPCQLSPILWLQRCDHSLLACQNHCGLPRHGLSLGHLDSTSALCARFHLGPTNIRLHCGSSSFWLHSSPSSFQSRCGLLIFWLHLGLPDPFCSTGFLHHFSSTVVLIPTGSTSFFRSPGNTLVLRFHLGSPILQHGPAPPILQLRPGLPPPSPPRSSKSLVHCGPLFPGLCHYSPSL